MRQPRSGNETDTTWTRSSAAGIGIILLFGLLLGLRSEVNPVPVKALTSVGANAGLQASPVEGRAEDQLLLSLSNAAETPFGMDQDDWSYGQIAEWKDSGAAMRIVAGPDGQIHVLGGVYVHHYEPSGKIVESTRVEDVKELEVGPAGEIFLAKTNEVMQVRRETGSVEWRKVITSDKHPIVGARPPYISSMMHDSFAGCLKVLYDRWNPELDDARNLNFVECFGENGTRKNSHALLDRGHNYWDTRISDFDEFVLNRSTNAIETYRAGEYAGSVPLPAPAIRFDIGPDGSFYFISERQYVFRVDTNGQVMDIFDATDPAPDKQSWITDLAVDAIGRVYVSDPATASVRVYAPEPGRTPLDPPEQIWHCRTAPDKWASPYFLQLGEKTKVTLRLGGNCPSLYEKADIVLVVDRSYSMSGTKIVAAQEAVRSFVGMMDLDRDQIGMVMYMNDPELLVPLSQNRQAILEAIPSLVPSGGTDIASALDLGIQQVLGPNHRPEAKPIIVLLTDGVPFNNTRLHTLEMGDKARDAGITVYTVGLGSDADPNLLKIMARSLEHYFHAPSAAELEEVYRQIARRIAASVLLKEVTVTDWVPTNMAYQENSAEPPAVWDANTRSLTWTFENVPFTGVEMSFWVEPLDVGIHPTNVGAEYDGTDGLDQPAGDVFPIPKVEVVSPGVPSPTPTDPPTATSVPPTVTPPPTPTVPTVEPTPVYIPIVFNDKCFQTYTDVVLILDNSTTMQGLMPDGRPKLEGAKDAAKALLSNLQLEPDALGYHDQASIVWYNDIARTAQFMTNDRQALLSAVDNINNPQQGSRIDLGLHFAHQQLILRDRKNKSNAPAVVLLTDGEPNRTSLEAVYAASDGIKDEGAVIYTVGFKDKFFREYVLREVATSDDHYFFSPKIEDLDDIYRQIAGELVCR